MNQFSTNYYFSKSKDIIYKNNNYSIFEKNKKNYNKYLIKFFSKTNDSKKNKITSFSSMNQKESNTERKYIKENKNLKLWLLLNSNKKSKNIHIKTNSLKKNNSNEFINAKIYINDSLNESYSYIKNFIFDNYRETKKHCQLKKNITRSKFKKYY